MTCRAGLLDRFWAKVDVRGPDECWPWSGGCYHDDYGMVGIRNQGKQTTMRAHVLALIFTTGEDANGRYGLHSCDNPPCCNPRHLRWGDQKQNIADMDERGRACRPVRRGEANPRAKLTAGDVRALRARHAAGETQTALAVEFGVTQQVVSAAVLRQTWKDVA